MQKHVTVSLCDVCKGVCSLRKKLLMITLYVCFLRLVVMCVDLHTHSLYSDGTVTPVELLRMAADSGLKGFSLTDHDTVDGVQEAVQAGNKLGINVLTGIEISALHRGYSLHILGYGIDPDNPRFLHRLTRLQQGRKERNVKILEKLAVMGIDISGDELDRQSGAGQTGRPHIARILMNRGYVRTMREAFSLYLGRNKPAWQSRFTYTTAETIEMLHQAGGIAVFAHPGQLDPGMKVQPQIIRELVELKLDGLEIFYPGHTRKIQNRLKSLAKKYNLLATGGSDYHGGNRAGNLAGTPGSICPPDSIMQEIRNRLHDSIPTRG